MFNFLFGNKTKDKVKVLSPQEYKAKLTELKGTLVDVRTPQEFKAGHIKKAVNIDFRSMTFASHFQKYNKEKPLFIYCRSGMRSMMAGRKLIQMGFKEVYDLRGGYLNWD